MAPLLIFGYGNPSRGDDALGPALIRRLARYPAAPYRLAPVSPDREASYTTHAMSPGALLWVHTQIGYGPPPPCLLLRIRGYHFALGAPLSAGARANLERAEGFLVGYLGVG